MSFSFSDLNNIKVESLIQQGLDTILQRQTEEKNKSGKTKTLPPQLRKRSLDSKGELYELPPTHSLTLAAYQLRRKGSQGSILVTLEHLKKLYQSLNKEILASAAKGDLPTAENLWKQQKNIDIVHYTHRIKVYRVNQAKILSWIVDLDLRKEGSHEPSHSSGTSKAALEALMIHFLDEPNAKNSSRDYLDTLVNSDWIPPLIEISRPFYHHDQLEYKIVFRQPPRLGF